MPNASRAYHRTIKNKLESAFMDVLRRNIPESILRLDENIPLIKDEKQMTMAPLYSPTCDIAVGPFSFEQGNLSKVYDNLAAVSKIGQFISTLQDSSLGDGYNEHLLDLNPNPRCFIAIEVENSTAHDVKHLLGSITNCSLLAKIGIVVVFDDYLKYAERLIGYLAFVKRVKKTNKELFRNVFVISKSRIDDLLQI
jgi:hypothetical protein